MTVQSGGSGADPQVRLVADTGTRDPQTMSARDLSVALPDRTLPSRAVALLSARSDVVVALDTTAAAAPGLAEVRSGITDLLLQLPPGARSGAVVINDRPRVLAPLASGATDALGRLSEVQAAGQAPDAGGSAATAVGLALRALGRSGAAASGDGSPAASLRPRLLVLQTSARDAGGESAAALGERLRRASVVLEVVTAPGGSAYWRTAAEATGGLVAEAGSGSGSASGSAVAAFTRISDALRHTFLVSFARPAAAVDGVSVRFGGAAGGAGAFVDLTTPGSPASAATTSGGAAAGVGSTAGPHLGTVVNAVALVLVALAAALVLHGMRRRPRGAHEAGAPVRPVPPRGARPAPRHVATRRAEPRPRQPAPVRAPEPEPPAPALAPEAAHRPEPELPAPRMPSSQPAPEPAPEPELESPAVTEARRRARATAAGVAAAAHAAAPLRPAAPSRGAGDGARDDSPGDSWDDPGRPQE